MAFPALRVTPEIMAMEEHTDCILSSLPGYRYFGFHTVGKKVLYFICVKLADYSQLKEQLVTRWRALLSVSDGVCPSWRLV